MYRRISFTLFILLSSQGLFAQLGINIQGEVRDAYSQPLVLAQLEFTALDQTTMTASSDTAGIFRLSQMPAGRYDIKISAIGHQSQLIRDYLIGRTNVPLVFELTPLSTDLPEVIISERKNGIFLHALSNALVVSREETERLPAGFFDPARLFTSQPGVSSMNDGANHLIIRGNNPAFVKWMIHGTEILNPNHLSNAGTFSDQASPSGGGVNMVSASVLDNTYLYKNPAPATIGNTLAGALDLNLRRGSTEKLTTEAQISLIGMEIGLEGPLSRNGASFLARYRYSTVGLLSQFGIQFGDENISYQDIMVHAAFPTKRRELSFFLFSGSNANDYAGKKDSTKRTIDKESSDIKFKGGQWIAGVLHEYKLNETNRLLTDIVYSENNTSRRSSLLDRIESNEFGLRLDKLNLHSRWVDVLHDDMVWTTGIQLQSNHEKLDLIINEKQTTSHYRSINYATIQPYTNVLFEIKNISLQGGLHGLATNKQFSLEPRAQLSYKINATNSIQFNIGKYGQIFSNFDQIYLLKSFQTQLSFQTQHHSLSWRIEGYYQHHYDIPAQASRSLISEAPFPDLLTTNNTSTGRVIGMETGLNGSLGKWRYNTNLAVFHSTFIDQLKNQFDSRFDQHYLLHVSIGREWEKQKNKYKKLFGWYSAFHAGGAMRDSPIDFDGQTATIRTNALYSLTRPGLVRLDTRIYRRKFYKNLNTLLALDIQNLTSHQNFSYSYYDYTRKAVAFNYQLGILPNLSFTIEF